MKLPIKSLKYLTNDNFDGNTHDIILEAHTALFGEKKRFEDIQ